METEIWNREELYSEVWDKPLVKLGVKYGISAVMVGKVCRKLQIPLPGRGYWVKKEFGKPVERLPLPQVKDLPVVQRLKQTLNRAPVASIKSPSPEPTDPEWVRIVEMESRTFRIDSESKQHKLIKETALNLKHARTDDRGILQRQYDQPCLDICVSVGTLQRALNIMNAVIHALEAEGFPVSLASGRYGTGAQIFGHRVTFDLVEKVREKSRRQVQETPSWTRTIIAYEPTGLLKFRFGEYRANGIRDGKKQSLEGLVSQFVGVLMREGRSLQIRAEQAKSDELERQKKRQEMAELGRQIEEEEKKVLDLDGWVNGWFRAKQMRDFITALEQLWNREGHDLSPTAPKGQRIIWMRQQADRVDPMVPSPPSILDRKSELNKWW
jgi:hypothetical protein